MFLSPFNILPFTADDAVIAGTLRGHLEQKGASTSFYDIQIVAQGFSRMLTVMNNTEEYSRIPNLMLEDWVIEIRSHAIGREHI